MVDDDVRRDVVSDTANRDHLDVPRMLPHPCDVVLAHQRPKR